jgi:MFS family permease
MDNDTQSVSPPAQKTARQARRIAVASFTGTVIEFYDFTIYGTAAALVFPRVLFPALGTAMGTTVSFATYGVAFVARPFGGFIFGHFGDRLGRKKTLVTSLLGMGIATVLVGLVPTASQIGVAAPIIVVLLRIVQGLAAGGEWAGATLFVTEHAPRERRGMWAIYPLLGGTVAFALANGTVLITGLGMSNATFTTWGWRIPFVASAILIAVGLWMRLRIQETPVFSSEIARTGGSRIPVLDAFREQPREILLSAGTGLTTFSFFYLTGTYLVDYATRVERIPRNDVLAIGVLGGIVLTVATIAGARVSDRAGRRPVLLWSHICGFFWALALFPVLRLGSVAGFALVMVVTMVLAGVNYGPLGSFIPELFRTRYRYTATGISYNLGTVIGGAATPLLAPILGAVAFGALLSALCLVALGCTLALPETRATDMDRPAPAAC